MSFDVLLVGRQRYRGSKKSGLTCANAMKYNKHANDLSNGVLRNAATKCSYEMQRRNAATKCSDEMQRRNAATKCSDELNDRVNPELLD
jgi:hypothetical protein